MTVEIIPTPVKGEPITYDKGQLDIPPNPIIPFIEGDGIGPDIWKAARPVLDAAVKSAYQGIHHLCWLEVLAGEKALAQTGSLLPDKTIQAFEYYRAGIKGPLTTPVGGGHRSLNVALRRQTGPVRLPAAGPLDAGSTHTGLPSGKSGHGDFP